MSVESAKTFMKKLTSDADFRAQVEAAKTEDDRKNVVKAAGFDFTMEELKSAVPANFHKSIDSKAELSEADLEKVAGGKSASWVGTTASAAGAGIAAAAAAA